MGYCHFSIKNSAILFVNMNFPIMIVTRNFLRGSCITFMLFVHCRAYFAVNVLNVTSELLGSSKHDEIQTRGCQILTTFIYNQVSVTIRNLGLWSIGSRTNLVHGCTLLKWVFYWVLSVILILISKMTFLYQSNLEKLLAYYILYL